MKSYFKGMLIACLFYPFILNAQNEVDALRYSQSIFGSTARSLAMGGAFGALGADFSTISTNPAGIGVYRKSEFTFSLGFNNRNSEAEFIGKTSNENKFNLHIPDIGLVFAFAKDRRNGWKQFGLALGYNRTNNFSSENFYEAKNENNSILQSFTEQVALDGGSSEADLESYYPFDVNLAYQTYLIDPDPNNPNQFVSIIPNGGTYQSRDVVTRGGMGEFSVGFGGNYEERFFFGVTLAFPGLRYEEESVYEENDKDNTVVSIDSTADFRSLKYTQVLNTSGNGVNGKFGIIFRPADWIRIGAAIHTPTYYYLNDRYQTSMSSQVGTSSYQLASPEGVYSYNLTTPFKAIGSLAFLFAKNGAIGLEYEFVDYTSAKLDASDYNFSTENTIIRKIYNDVGSNLRGGVEWKYENFAFRAGAVYYSSPFRKDLSDEDSDQKAISYTGGIGYRENRYFFDIGYAYTQRSEFYRQYTLTTEPVPGAVTTFTDHRIVATFGIRF